MRNVRGCAVQAVSTLGLCTTDQFEADQFVALIRDEVFNHHSRLKTLNERMNCAEKVLH